MAILDETGVYQLKNGKWAYRYTTTSGGHKKDVRKAKDIFGNPFLTKKAAIKARQTAIVQENAGLLPKKKPRKTFNDVFTEYQENSQASRAYTTVQKQNSLWDNHISPQFGKRYVDDVSVAEVMDYLTNLYYKKKYSYRYVEGFLKMFYLIFGQAYSRDYLDVDAYNKLCVNKNTKIKMPKEKTNEDRDIMAFNKEELLLLDEYFKGSSAETAYLLGRYCGLRINECFGLKWDNVDLDAGTIRIDRQMQYQEGLIKLVPPKTKNANRTIYLCSVMKDYLTDLARKRQQDEIELAALREQRRRTLEDMDGSKILSTDLVNCMPDGTIQTVNSFKYPSKEIKKKFGIPFKYHYLRHTYGTMMAEMNTPSHLLCNQMGHGKIQVTQQYYLAVSKEGIDILKDNLNHL